MKKGLFFLVPLAAMFASGCNIFGPTPTPVPPTATPSQRVVVVSTSTVVASSTAQASPRPASPTAPMASPSSAMGTATPTPTLTPTVQPTPTRTPLPPALLPVGTRWEMYGADSGVDDEFPVSFDPTKGPWNLSQGSLTGAGRFEVVARGDAPATDTFSEANYVIKSAGDPFSTFYYYKATPMEMSYLGTTTDREGALSKKYTPPERVADWNGGTAWMVTMSIFSGDQMVGEAVSEVKMMANGRLTVPTGEYDATLYQVKTSEKSLGIVRSRIEYRWLAKIDGKYFWAASIASKYNETKEVFTVAQRFTRLKALEWGK